MSLRYVWNRYNKSAVASDWSNGIGSYKQLNIINQVDVTWDVQLRNSIYSFSSTNYPVSRSGSGFAIEGDKLVIKNPSAATSGAGKEYFIISMLNTGINSIFVGLDTSDANEYHVVYEIEYTITTSMQFLLLAANATGGYFRPDTGGIVSSARGRTHRVGAGSLVGTISNASPSTYPPRNNRSKITNICTIRRWSNVA